MITIYISISLLALLMSIFLSVLMVPFISRNGFISLFYPPVFFVIFYIVFFLVPSSLVLLNPNGIIYRYQLGGYEPSTWVLTLSFSFLFVCLTCFITEKLAPFSLFKKSALESARNIMESINPKFDFPYFLIFIAIPLASLGYLLVQFGGDAYQEYMVNRIVARSGLGFVIMPSTWLATSIATGVLVGILGKNRKFYLIISMISFIFFVIAQLYLGSKSRGLIVIIYALLGWIFIRSSQEKFSFKFLVLTPVVAAAILGVGLWFGDLREATTRGVSAEDVETRVSTSALFSKVNAFGAIENTLWLVENTSYKDYIMGRSFAAVVVGIVPRTVWPDKPVGGGPELRNLIHPGSYDLNAGFQLSSYSTGIIAESYMNFGFLGFLIVAPGLGFILAFLAKQIVKVDSLTLLTIYVIVLYRFVYIITGEVFNTFSGVFMTVIPIFLVKLLKGIGRSTSGRSLPGRVPRSSRAWSSFDRTR